ncbi:MAG: TCP-1/cpn60 chaperonin family protein [Nitrososphaerota archaeon]
MNYKKLNAILTGRFLWKNELLTENLYYIERLGEMLKTSLGPTGNSKIIFNKQTGEYKLTKDGERILREVKTLHPVISILADAGIAVKKEVGDGSLMTSILAVELYKKAVNLMREGLHPHIIIEGYNKALRIALDTLRCESKPVKFNEKIIFSLVKTSLASKLDLRSSTYLAEIVTKLLANRQEDIIRHKIRMLDTIIIKTRAGGSIEDSRLIHGVLLHKSGADLMMPKKIKNAKIAIIENDLGFKRPDLSVNFMLKGDFNIKKFYDTRWEILNDILNAILKTGANVILCKGNISEELRRLFVLKNVLAIRNVSSTDLNILKNATNAMPITNVKNLTTSHLGECNSVNEVIISALDRWTIFEGCANPSYCSILLRGVSEKILETINDAVQNSIKSVILAINDLGYVPGGGAVEMRIACQIRNAAYKYDNKTQLAMLSYAEAIEDTIMTLGINCGIDPITMKSNLKSHHNKGEMVGIDQYSRKIVRPSDLDILDATHVKIQCFKSATEAASSLIRIDFVHYKERIKEEPKSVIPEPVKQVREATENYLKSQNIKK